MESEKGGKGEEERWFSYETRVDEKGRLNIPPDIREDMGIYGKAAKVSVKAKVVKLYGGPDSLKVKGNRGRENPEKLRIIKEYGG